MAHINLVTEESSNPNECSDSSYSASKLLPFVLIIEIISRLPVKSIIRFKSVCKTWCDLISEPYFTKAYLKNPQFDANVVVHTRTVDQLDLFYFVEIGEKVIHKPFNPKSHDFRPDTMYRALVGSHNGLLCLFETLRVQQDMYSRSSCFNGVILKTYKDQTVWIVNPLIGEYIKLPKVREDHVYIHYHNDPSYGFGSSIYNDHYKVIRIAFTVRITNWNLAYKLEAKILTVGVDDEWRDIEDFTIGNLLLQHGITVNGFLHWVDPSGYIYAFDIGKEKGHLMSLPRISKNPIFLANSDGRLCFTDNESSGDVHIWTMKQYGVESSWTRDIILKMSVNCIQPLDPITTMRNGNLLMSLRYHQHLFSYDPKKNKFIEFEGSDVNGKSCVFTYVPSFISLRILFKRTNDAPPLVVDESKTCTSIQIRLADGTQIVSRFNTYLHTIRDIRAFIDHHVVASNALMMYNYQLQSMVVYPPRKLTDLDQTINQAGIANSVVIEKIL